MSERETGAEAPPVREGDTFDVLYWYATERLYPGRPVDDESWRKARAAFDRWSHGEDES